MYKNTQETEKEALFELDENIEEQIEQDINNKSYEIEDNYVSGKDAFSMYLDDIGECKPISKEEERELFEKVQNGDSNAKEQIFKANARLVIYVAKKYAWAVENNPTMGFEDLVSVGNLGLLKAIDRFDLSLNYKFSTYAYNWIYSFVERHVINYGGAIRLPAHLQEKMRIIKKKQKEMEIEKGRGLTSEEEDEILRSVVGNAEDVVRRFKMGYIVSDVIYLNTRVQKGEDAEDTEFMDFVESPMMQPDEECYCMIMKEELLKAMDECLSKRSADVLKYRFGFVTGKTMTLDEVGKIFGVTRERIRQIESKALRTLRRSRKCYGLREYIKNM